MVTAPPKPKDPNPPKRDPLWLVWLFGSLIVVLVFTVVSVATVHAIADPDSITIVDIRAYDAVLEADDLLVIVEYNLTYTSTPTDLITDSYIGRFKRGTTDLNAVDPFAFNDNGFGRGLFSFYWSASQKSTDSIEFDDSNSEGYTVTLQGKVGIFPGVVPSTTTATINWQAATDTKDLLQSHIKALAQKLEKDPNWADNTNFDDLITTGGGVDQLTTQGEEYFANAIPQLQVMIPAIFSAGITTPGFTETSSTRSYDEDLSNFWDGNWVDVRFQTLATTLRVPKRVITALFAILMMAVIAAFCTKLLENTENGAAFGMLTFAVTLPMATAVGWVPLNLALVIASVCIIGVAWTLFGRRAGG